MTNQNGHLDVGKLENVKQSGGKVIARCPACKELGKDSGGNHLVIFADQSYACIAYPGTMGTDHRKRVFELAGTVEPVLNRSENAKPEKASWETFEAARNSIARYHDKVTGEWDYVEEHGKIVLKLVRYDKAEGGKTYFPFHENHEYRWETGVPTGAKLPLYHLESIPTARRVFVVEGEKCADALDSIGLIAVTSQGGALASYRTDWTPLAGKEIIILPDNDSNGSKYANTVKVTVEKLSPPASAYILEMPEVTRLGEGADIADYLETVSEQPSAILARDIDFRADMAILGVSGIPPIDAKAIEQEATNALPEGKETAVQTISLSGSPTVTSTAPQTASKDISKAIILASQDRQYRDVAKDVFERLATKKTIFNRGGKVISLNGDILELVSPEAFRTEVEKLGPVMAWRKGRNNNDVLQPAHMGQDEARVILASSETTKLPEIKCVVSCPILAKVENGVEKLEKGYHEGQGVMVLDGHSEDMPLEQARELIFELFNEFSFVSEGDRTRAIAALLTPALKLGGWLKKRCPCFSVEADQSQTGKGYLTELIFSVYGENPSDITLKNGGVGSFDESLASALVRGKPFIRIDNTRGKLDSQFLESVLTAQGYVSARIPHRGDMPIDPSPFSFFLTSNGVELTGDMANRSCLIRLRKREDYAFKRYVEGDLKNHVESNRSKYLGAVHTVLKAHSEKGMHRSETTEHAFREWGQLLDAIARDTLGLPAGLLEGHSEARRRVASPAITFFRAVAIAIENENGFEKDYSASDLAELAENHDIDLPSVPDGDSEQRKICIGRLARKAFGNDADVLKIDDYQVNRSKEDLKREDGKGFRPIWKYRFEKLSADKVSPQDVIEMFLCENNKEVEL